MDERKKKQIAVIGSEEFTLGFKIAGVDEIYGKKNYAENMEELLMDDSIGIVVAKADDVDELPRKLRKRAEESVEPVVVKLSEQPGSERINEEIKRAIGVDLS
ncbi:MAG: V-type ATP synthase subunit F [Candidatus Nanohaloarchaea archaeon]